MKKIIFIVSLMLAVFIVSACDNKDVEEVEEITSITVDDSQSHETVEEEEGQPEEEQENEETGDEDVNPEDADTEESDGAEQESESVEKRVETLKKDYPGPVLPESNVFTNEECGYTFEFPQEWSGWYFVNDQRPQSAVIRFYGKSLRGTVVEKAILSEYDYGLTMFFILSEEEVNEGTYDSVKKIGTAKGVNYYFATTTDVSLAPIIGDGEFWFDEAEGQEELREADWKKVSEMQNFYNDEECLINAFKEI